MIDGEKHNSSGEFSALKVNYISIFLVKSNLAMLISLEIYPRYLIFIQIHLSPCLIHVYLFLKIYLSHAYKIHAYKKKHVTCISNNRIRTLFDRSYFI